jgi:CheY-like chemotaxis protein
MIQVLENLFTNASKYTPDSGSIDVSLQTGPGHSTLLVRDNGRGIAKDKLEAIFDMFAQCESSIDRRDAGMGVGLTLVKSIVEMHGGTVTARSAGLGQGSEFVVVMPTTEATSPPTHTRPAASPSRSLRIVLVEDNDESRRTLKMLLELDGYSVQTASDGRQGLELIQAEKPDAAILDIGLPGINGYELASRLRENFPPDRLHLIALTGYGRAEDRAAVNEAGFNDHLVKPIQIDMLLASLARADGSLRLRQDTAGDG